MKIILCQHGARHRYAIARFFYEADMLAALYTDSTAYSWAGKTARLLARLGIRTKALQRLMNRRPEIPRNLLHTTDCCLASEIRARVFHRQIDWFQRWCVFLSRRMIRWGVRDADRVYNMYNENLLFLRYVRKARPEARILVDVYINPLTKEMVAEARDKEPEDFKKLIAYNKPAQRQITQEVFALADVLLCPSRFVADGVKQLSPECADKIRIVPYGSSIIYTERNRPVRGRFFFAGADWYRKGLHFFAQAATALKQKYPDMDFRVAGVTDPAVTAHPLFKDLNFLGRLNAAQMKQEFLTADAFVLPSMSEGMASVVLEAMAAGCPAVVTDASGIDAIRDGVNGLKIQPDTASVTAQLEKLYLDRELREKIAGETVKCCDEYSCDLWKERLLKVVREA